MIVPDTNLLLYAVDKLCPDHTKAALWWRRSLSGDEEVGLCSVVAFAFLRLSTNRRAFRHPLSVEDACRHIDNWLEFPNVVWLDCLREDFDEATRLLMKAGTGGNLVTDAQIAAIASRLGASVHSCDHDFARFSGINWNDPLG